MSADMTHATHPNYAEWHEQDHLFALGRGPVVTMSAITPPVRRPAPRSYPPPSGADLTVQYLVDKSGALESTIGPIVAAGLTIPCVDVGIRRWSILSACELCGTADPGMLIATLRAFLTPRMSGHAAWVLRLAGRGSTSPEGVAGYMAN